MNKNIDLNVLYESVKAKCSNDQIIFFEGKNGEIFAGAFRLVFEDESTVPKALYAQCFETYTMESVSSLTMLEFKDIMFLDLIYTNKNYRNLGIAKTLLLCSEDILKDFGVHEILGEFGPHDFHCDTRLEDLSKTAKLFYDSLGYEIIDYNKCINFPQLYPENLKYYFFCADLIYKRLDSKKNINLIEHSNYFMEESLAEKLGLVKNLGE